MVIPIALYFIVGIISLVMALKCFFSKKFLPFQEQATGKPWSDIENPLKHLILSLLKLSGLGFLIVSILLLIFPIVNSFIPSIFYKYSIPVTALIFCSGLFIINFLLYKKTKAGTPWKGSLYSSGAILAGIIISIFN
jgi:hypothetical protein